MWIDMALCVCENIDFNFFVIINKLSSIKYTINNLVLTEWLLPTILTHCL